MIEKEINARIWEFIHVHLFHWTTQRMSYLWVFLSILNADFTFTSISRNYFGDNVREIGIGYLFKLDLYKKCPWLLGLLKVWRELSGLHWNNHFCALFTRFPARLGNDTFQLVLSADVSCDNCVMQWIYRAGKTAPQSTKYKTSKLEFFEDSSDLHVHK